METLRNELIETQTVRSDLIKWKLLIVAGIGGTALGLSGGASPTPSSSAAASAPLALAVIPFACVYVDLLCRHLSLRNKAIGLFIRSRPIDCRILSDYEVYYKKLSDETWAGKSLESLALVGCTVFVSVAIVPIGILASGLHLWPPPTEWSGSLLIGSGIAGVAFSLWLERRYRRLKSAADDCPPESGAATGGAL